MGVTWSRKNVKFDEEEWKRLSPPEIPLAEEFIERQEVRERVNEANEKMMGWEQPRAKELKVEFADEVEYREPSVKIDSPGVVECDCGRCWN